jgi:RNA polymerase sigma-70 factor (ECF subfamily)
LYNDLGETGKVLAMSTLIVQESKTTVENEETINNSVIGPLIIPKTEAGLEEEQVKEQLVTRALQGDQQAFSDIVDQYSTLMLRTASMIVGDHDIAEDVVQDALIQAWHHLGNLRKAGALRPWLMRIVVNQCISFKRRLARTTAFMRQTLSEQETDLAAQIADDHKGLMERDWDLAHAIENLPMKQRVAIVLHYYNGMTLPEMAVTLSISENTLKKRIQAALTNLRHMLEAPSFYTC